MVQKQQRIGDVERLLLRTDVLQRIESGRLTEEDLALAWYELKQELDQKQIAADPDSGWRNSERLQVPRRSFFDVSGVPENLREIRTGLVEVPIQLREVHILPGAEAAEVSA